MPYGRRRVREKSIADDGLEFSKAGLGLERETGQMGLLKTVIRSDEMTATRSGIFEEAIDEFVIYEYGLAYYV
ncbi:hypothetical protein TcasGA2_TC008743 [Tribolium castaneum]|uniref:Uncharacterized protein n=1 Tax=Tribolium castaneum TaxID=7070 RepID=D6WS69_TRICA|nr:hypothetical protein TcasGA2_TC008743 [Tribolium castaneum]